MPEATRKTVESYPRQAEIGEERTVLLRLMERSDRDRIVDFARALPPRDLLFLRRDITDPEVVDEWVRDIERGRTVTVLAEKEGELLAYGSLWLDETFWGRDMGEIRVQVSSSWRGLGLGLLVASEVFAIAKDLGLERIIARLTKEQERTRAMLERLGFARVAVRRGFVLDRDGKPRDLLCMSAGIAHLTDAEAIAMVTARRVRLGGLARQSSRHGWSPVGVGPARFGELGTDEPLISASSVWSMRMTISFPAFGSPETRSSSMNLRVCSTYPALPRRCPPYMSVSRSLVA